MEDNVTARNRLQPYDEAIIEASERAAATFRADRDAIALQAIEDAQVNLESAKARLEMTIRIARGNKLSWTAIGNTFKMSRQSAWQRFAHLVNDQSEQ